MTSMYLDEICRIVLHDEGRFDHMQVNFRSYMFMLLYLYMCQDSSVVRFLRVDPMVNGSSPISAILSLRARRVTSSPFNPGVGLLRCGHTRGRT